MAENSDDWQQTDTLCLIKLYGELKQASGTQLLNNNEIFIKIANQLFEHGYSKSYLQCRKKWHELLKIYQNFKESSDAVIPLFYTELDKILSDTPDSSTENVMELNEMWSVVETNLLIRIMKLNNYVEKLKISNPNIIFEQIAKNLQSAGHRLRRKEEIQNQWNCLKHSYIKYIKGDLLHFKYFDSMDALLDWNPKSTIFQETYKERGEEKVNVDANYLLEENDTRDAEISKRSSNWSHKETEKLLDVALDYDFIHIKRENMASFFDDTSLQLRLHGYKRSAEQCRVKLKQLRTKYMNALKKIKGGNDQVEQYCPHFDKLHKILHTGITQENANFSKDDLEYYEIEYLEDNEEDLQLFEKVYLKDMHHNSASGVLLSKSSRKCRSIWTEEETQYFLNLLKQRYVKRYCRKEIFEEVAEEMTKVGYKKSGYNCIIKWKNLRNQLYTSVRNMVKGKEVCPFYDDICEVIEKSGSTLDVSSNCEQDQHELYSEPEDQSTSCENILNSELKTTKIIKDENVLNILKNKIPVNDEDDTSSSSKKLKISDNISQYNDKFTCNFKMDDAEHYCISLASTFKRLSKVRQAKLKIEIQKLLYRAEFEDDF